ncbi:unnamed protein product, partial [Scytosiphon promiscuus]
MRDELFTAGVLLVVFLLILTLQSKLSLWVSRTQLKYKKYVRFLVGLIFPLMYFFIVKNSAGYLKGPISQIIFISVAYYYLGYYFIKNLLEPLRIGYVPWNFFSYILLLIATVFLMLIRLNETMFKSHEIQ